jgi:hypothetical protein
MFRQDTAITKAHDIIHPIELRSLPTFRTRRAYRFIVAISIDRPDTKNLILSADLAAYLIFTSEVGSLIGSRNRTDRIPLKN